MFFSIEYSVVKNVKKIQYINVFLAWFKLFWPSFHVKLGQYRCKPCYKAQKYKTYFFTFFTTECSVSKNRQDSLYQMLGRKECFLFFTTECLVEKNGWLILSSHHFWVNLGWNWPCAQMNRIHFWIFKQLPYISKMFFKIKEHLII